MAEAILENVENDEAMALFGSRDENLRVLRDSLGLKIVARKGTISLQGAEEQVNRGKEVLDRMRSQYRSRRRLSPADIRVWLDSSVIEAADRKPEAPLELTGSMRRLRARSAGQNRYVQAIRDHELTFCVGPAGTGKTYLAVATALEALHNRQIKRIVLVRPLVEAGEKLGYLPGDMLAKVHPFLRPLLDALRDMLDFQQVKSHIENDIIEIVPLAYMRGRTLNEAFIILDEAQNTTIPQMKMFLTRMGMGSKIVVTGDPTQIDLPHSMGNGLQDAVRRLGRIERIAIVRMQNSDIVRHSLVEAIVNAYDEKSDD